jgi:hypothetical protein
VAEVFRAVRATQVDVAMTAIQDNRDPQVRRDNRELQALKDLRDRTEPLAAKDLRDHEDQVAHQDRRDRADSQETLETGDHRDQQDHQDRAAHPDHRDHQDLLGSRDLADLRESMRNTVLARGECSPISSKRPPHKWSPVQPSNPNNRPDFFTFHNSLFVKPTHSTFTTPAIIIVLFSRR